MELGSLGTLLGAATGFVGVMLVLSLVSTGLSQTIQNVASLRGRAELWVLMKLRNAAMKAAVFPVVPPVPYPAAGLPGAAIPVSVLIVPATQGTPETPPSPANAPPEAPVVSEEEIEPMPGSVRKAVGQHALAHIRGMRVKDLEWMVEYSDFFAAWGDAGFRGTVRRFVCWLAGPNKHRISKADYLAKFPGGDYTEYLILARETYTRWMRRISIFAAFVVAFGMQVDATDLLQRLSTDPELRAKALAAADRSLASEDVRGASAADRKLVEQAVSELGRTTPSLAGPLEQWSGEARTLTEARRELELILQDQPDGASALERYDALLAEKEKAREGVQAIAGAAAQEELALLDIRFHDDLSAFCASDGSFNWRHLVGVLITALLLTFGAPFWYEVLRNVRAIGTDVKEGKRVE